MKLPPILDLAAASPLWTELCAARRQPLVIDASEVERLGGQCLQLLLAAQRAWRDDEVVFAIEHPSAAFADALRRAGAHSLMTTESGL